MSEWKEYKLGEVCLKITDGSHNSPPTTTAGYPMASVKDMEYNKINLNSCRTISKEDYQKLVKNDCRPQINDVLIAKDGSYLKHVFDIVKEEDVVLLSSIAIIRPNIKKVISKYLKYIFKNPSFVQLIESNYVTGAVIPRIVLKDFKNIDIRLPSLPEQRAIASVLSSLDDKIDMLHRQNKTLEALAETLFRQWFVEDAEEGWGTGKLGDVLELLYGKALKEEIRTGKGFPVIGSSGVVGFHSEFLEKGPGIVIGRKGTLGKVIYLFDNFFPIDTTYYIKSKVNSVGLFYEYFLLKTLNFEEMNSDSAVPGLNRDIALSTEIKIAPLDKLNEFNQYCSTLLDKLKANNQQIRTLTNLRDMLLPKLISGQIRIKNLENLNEVTN